MTEVRGMEWSVRQHMGEVVTIVKQIVSLKRITDEYVVMVHSTREMNNVMTIMPPTETDVATQDVILKHLRVASMHPLGQ